MHELNIMQQVVRLVEEISRSQGPGHPSIIRLHISAHSHLADHTPSELQTTFQMAAHGTRAQTAQLEIVTIRSHGICQMCSKKIVRQGDMVSCPTCGSSHVLWEDNPEVLVKEVEWLEDRPTDSLLEESP